MRDCGRPRGSGSVRYLWLMRYSRSSVMVRSATCVMSCSSRPGRFADYLPSRAYIERLQARAWSKPLCRQRSLKIRRKSEARERNVTLLTRYGRVGLQGYDEGPGGSRRTTRLMSWTPFSSAPSYRSRLARRCLRMLYSGSRASCTAVYFSGD